MSLAGTAFTAALGLSGLAVVAGLVAPRRVRALLVGIATAAAGAAGVVAGLAALGGGSFSAWLPDLLPLAGVRLALDPLGGLFVAVTGAVAVCAAVYGIGYVAPRAGEGGSHGDGRAVQATLPLFVAAMLLVPAAASVSTLLVAWELMALTSLLLVLAEHRRRAAVAEAGRWYAVMTHFGLLVILAGLVGFAAAAHGESFAQLRAAAGGMSPAVRGAVFVVTLLGFASKAGVVPLHVWLPRAHPEAPSYVSALMSAAMVNLGVYGVLRVGLDPESRSGVPANPPPGVGCSGTLMVIRDSGDVLARSLNPPKTSEWTTPRRAQASIETGSSGTIGGRDVLGAAGHDVETINTCIAANILQ